MRALRAQQLGRDDLHDEWRLDRSLFDFVHGSHSTRPERSNDLEPRARDNLTGPVTEPVFHTSRKASRTTGAREPYPLRIGDFAEPLDVEVDESAPLGVDLRVMCDVLLPPRVDRLHLRT